MSAPGRTYRVDSQKVLADEGWALIESWRGGAYNRLLSKIYAECVEAKVFTPANASEMLVDVRRAWATCGVSLPSLPNLCLYEYAPRRCVLLWRDR